MLHAVERRVQSGDGSRLPKHRYNLVDPRADRAARQRHPHRLRELPELHPEPLQHPLERPLDVRLVKAAVLID